jgi:ribosome-binding factor A
MASQRQRKVQELLVQEISQIIRRELKDPHVGFVTITDAEVSPDLRHARVFYSVLGDQSQREETGKALNRAAGFIRGEFARRASMRYVPEIRFHFDTSVERGARIHELLEQVKREDEDAARAAGTGGDGDPEGE